MGYIITVVITTYRCYKFETDHKHPSNRYSILTASLNLKRRKKIFVPYHTNHNEEPGSLQQSECTEREPLMNETITIMMRFMLKYKNNSMIRNIIKNLKRTMSVYG